MNHQRVCEFMSRQICREKISNGTSSIVAYPQNNVRDIAKIMRDIKIESLPVLFSPWNKKLIGFIEYRKISAFLND